MRLSALNFTAPRFLLVSLLAVGLLAGCASNPQIRHLMAKRHAPHPPDYPIAITSGDIQEAYRRLALVRTPLYDEWDYEQAGRAELERLARQLGGDAVIEATATPTFSKRGGLGLKRKLNPAPQGKMHYTGVVVRFLRRPPPPLPPPAVKDDKMMQDDKIKK
jgi:hypothetical protein